MMNFEYSEKVTALQIRVRDFMERHVIPANTDWHHQADQGIFPIELMERLKVLAKTEGLWNFFYRGCGRMSRAHV